MCTNLSVFVYYMWLLCNPLTSNVLNFDQNDHATKILQQCWPKLLLKVLQYYNKIYKSTITWSCFDQLPEFSNTKMFYYANTYNVLLGHSKSWPHPSTIGRNIHATLNTWTSPQIREVTRDYANISTKGLKVKLALTKPDVRGKIVPSKQKSKTTYKMFYPSFWVLVFWVATLFHVNSNKKHTKNKSCKRVGTRS